MPLILVGIGYGPFSSWRSPERSQPGSTDRGHGSLCQDAGTETPSLAVAPQSVLFM